MKSRREGEGAILCFELAKEKICFNFSEGYRKFVFASEVTTAELKRPAGASDWEWRPSGKFTWSARGSEYSIGREWSGKRTDFETKFSEIVATCLDGLERQPIVHTMLKESDITPYSTRRTHRTYTREVKAQLVAACRKRPGIP